MVGAKGSEPLKSIWTSTYDPGYLVPGDDGVGLGDGWRNDERGGIGRRSGLEFAKRFLQLDIPSQAERTEDGDSVPVYVELIPGEAVTRGLRREVMIVVPAFAESEHGHPET